MFNAGNEQPHGGSYTSAGGLSPTQENWAEAGRIPYDPSQTAIPTLVLAGTHNDVMTPEGMGQLYGELAGPKAMALRADTGHGSMLYSGDGYVTAWLMYWLKGDREAGSAFFGPEAELLHNPMWQGARRSAP